MLRIVRLRERFTNYAAGSRGLILLAVAVAAGGCSAGLDLPPLNYNGGPSSTGAVAPVPREPMYQGRASAPSDYRSDDRRGSRSDAYPSAQMSDRGPPPMQESDRGVRMAGLPEPYDASPSYDRRPSPAPVAARAPHSTSFDTERAPPVTPPAPPRAAYEPPRSGAQLQGDTIEVRPGDTLYGLSQTHRVSIAELMRVNNLQGAQLRVGQRLVLPADRRRGRRVASLPSASDPMPAPQPAPRLTERAPAPMQASPERTFAPTHDPASGPIVPPLVETPPQESSPSAHSADAPQAAPRVVPSRTATSDDTGWTGSYTVERGDSLYGISRKHGIRLNDLERINSITNPRAIKPGMVLKVPQDGESKTARAAPSSAPIAQAEPPADRGSPAVQPTIINSRTRVAALGRAATDAPMEAAAPHAEPSAPAAAPSREAALPTTKGAMPPGKFRWPTRGKIIAGFGQQPGIGQNDGINISVPRGTDVHAAEGGVVTYAGDGVQGYGNLVLIRHQEGWITAYAHNDALMVKSGETVRRGQIIAKAGATGSVTQPQLHFEIRQGTKAVDPVQHLER